MFGVLLNYLVPDEIFGGLLAMVAWLVLWVWVSITHSHLFYRRGLPHLWQRRGAFRLWGSPYTNWAILVVIGCTAVALALNEGTRITFYVLVSWLFALTTAHYFTAHSRTTEGK